MTKVAASGGWPRQGVAPLDLRRDLGAVADLLDVAFREEKRDAPVPLQSAFSAVKALAPVLWLVAPLVPAVRSMFTGFVWIEDGRVVGNVNVTPLAGRRDVWLIGNVAVDPAYRRQGMATKLTDAAAELAHDRGARWVVLDVRDDNEKARGLYAGLGFRESGGTRELYLSASRLRRRALEAPPLEVVPPAGLVPDWDVPGEEAWALYLRSIAPASPELLGLRPSDFDQGWLAGVLSVMTAPLLGPSRFSIGLREGEELVAWAGLDNATGRLGNRLRMAVAPEWRGQVDGWLTAAAIERLEAAPAVDCWAVLPLAEEQAACVLLAQGFVQAETLLRLSLPLPR